MRASWEGARRRGAARLLALVALAPIALLGTLLNWIPFQLVRRIARSVRHEPDQPATFKLLASLVLFPLVWGGEAVGGAEHLGRACRLCRGTPGSVDGLARGALLRALGWTAARYARLAGAAQ